MSLSGSRFLIKPNLKVALQRLNKEKTERLVWIDTEANAAEI
jgi:hypothetical protein